jgi:hypothetical protein
MSRGTIISIAVCVVLAAAAGGAAMLGLFRHHTTPSEVEAVLRDRIAVGSSAERVAVVLDSLRVEHGGVQPDGTMYAVWRRTSISLFSETAIQGRFRFDGRQRLLSHDLEEVFIAM